MIHILIKLLFDIIFRSPIGTLAHAEILARKIHSDRSNFMFEPWNFGANDDWKIKLDQWPRLNGPKDRDSNVFLIPI